MFVEILDINRKQTLSSDNVLKMVVLLDGTKVVVKSLSISSKQDNFLNEMILMTSHCWCSTS